MTEKNRRLFTDLSLLTVAVIWALNFTIIKASLAEIDPYSFNAIRFLLAAGFLWAVVISRKSAFSVPKKDWLPLFILGLAGNVLYQWLFIAGIDFTYAANAAIILGTIPIWMALASHLMNVELLNRLKGIGVFAGFAGVLTIIVTGKNPISFGSDTFMGDLLILFAAVVWGVYSIFSKTYLVRYTPLQFSAIMTTFGAFFLTLLAIPHISSTNWAEVSPAAYGGALYSGLLAIGVAYFIWNNGLHYAGAVKTAMYQNLVPVLGLFFGIILLGERLLWLQYVGSAVVVAGIMFTRYGNRTQTRVPPLSK